MLTKLPLLCLAGLALIATTTFQGKQRKIGYDNTPIIPGTKWHVHDGKRPQPRVVQPGVASTQDKAGTAPSDAVVLFDGKDLSAWRSNKGEAHWKVEDGAFVVQRGGAIRTKEEFGDCQLHIEWMAPPPKGHGQGRGNSGLFFFGRYEVQILDSYENKTYPDGQAGALYGQYPPMVNACRKPGEWQSYDVIFEAPRFKDGKLAKPAYVTVFHNGVLLHHRRKLLGPTRHRRNTEYRPHKPKGPIQLQDHGNPVRFRNVWLRPLNFEG